jgi:hypothetical protein
MDEKPLPVARLLMKSTGYGMITNFPGAPNV